MWTFRMIFGQQLSARTALGPSRPQRLICSRRRSYIPATVTVPIMSLDVFIQKFLSIHLTDFTMCPFLNCAIRKNGKITDRETDLMYAIRKNGKITDGKTDLLCVIRKKGVFMDRTRKGRHIE